MKRLGIATAALATLLTLYGVSPRLAVEPVNPVAGETFMVMLELDVPGTPEFTLPEVPGLRSGRRVTSTRSSISIVNGRQEQWFQYAVAAVAERPGRVTIPAFQVTLNGKAIPIPAYTFTVRDPAKLSAPDGRIADRPQAFLRCLPDRPVYVGETVEAQLEVMIPAGMRATIRDIREIGFGDALFITQGRERLRFLNTGRRRAERDGVHYVVYELSGRFQPQQPGEFAPECELSMAVSRPSAADDFFGDFFAMNSAREMLVRAAAARRLTVRSLPPVPPDTTDSGLVGDWRMALTVPEGAEFKTGEVGELTLNVSGSGAAEVFHAPALTVPGARMYPPEVKRTASGFSVKYLFVPLTPGPRELQVNLAVFDPDKGAYRMEPCSVKFPVVPGAMAAVPPAAPPPPVSGHDGGTTTAPAVSGGSVLAPGRPVRVPLWENSRWGILIFTVVGAGCFLAGFLRRRRDADGSRRERRARRRKLAELASRLRSADRAARVLRDEGVAEIAAAVGLPPGATPGEIAEKMDDPELRAFFRTLDDAAFHPGGAAAEPPEIRRKLAKFLRRAVLIFLLGAFSGTGSAAEVEADRDAAYKAFDAGRYAEARTMFRRMIDPDAPDPNLLYNCGCAGVLLGEYPDATLAFEQALLLSPGNAGFRAAYQDSLKKLSGAPEEPDHSFTEFLAGLRDRCRPDRYLLLASAAFCLAGVLSLCGRFPGRTALGVFLAGIVLLSLLAAWTQISFRYSPSRARVVAVRAELHRVPVADGSVAGIVAGGTVVRIAGQRGDWTQIVLPDGRIGGWVKTAQIRKVCPHGIW
ncbi:MAG: BatD family protein [Lentisphaeria bacterium]|nr:BatD family protein [Lentisphaeria bacterium]